MAQGIPAGGAVAKCQVLNQFCDPSVTPVRSEQIRLPLGRGSAAYLGDYFYLLSSYLLASAQRISQGGLGRTFPCLRRSAISSVGRTASASG